MRRPAGGTILPDLVSLDRAKKYVDFRSCLKNASLVRGGRSSQGKIVRTTLTLNLIIEQRVLHLPPSQPQPRLNLYRRRGPLIRNVYLAPRLNFLFCWHHCAQPAVGYCVGITTPPEPEHRLFDQISSTPRESRPQFLTNDFPIC